MSATPATREELSAAAYANAAACNAACVSAFTAYAAAYDTAYDTAERSWQIKCALTYCEGDGEDDQGNGRLSDDMPTVGSRPMLVVSGRPDGLR